MPLVEDVLAGLHAAGLHIPLIIGGIIPDDDAASLRALGVAAIYTPKDFDLNRIMSDIVQLADPKPAAA
jgi:(2R)-ethylmalonyl-CoA mutase